MKRFTLFTLAMALLASTLWIATQDNAARAEHQARGPSSMVQSKAYLHSYNLPSSGVALEGYCAVAYIAANKAVQGKPEYASTYNDVTYYFVSADAKQLFDADPQKYLPAYGGWCAFGMAIGDKFPVDPTNFKVVNGKTLLFLKNKNVDALKLWNDGDEKANLAKAASHWRKVSQ
ncbi:MAG: hypothetical protein MI725_07495 [Pirellulales bacterium]|nr:hypothetical protein [Pirellulales bacterium]